MSDNESPVEGHVPARLQRIRLWMSKCGYDGIVLGSLENFSWLSAGGRGHFTARATESLALLAITASDAWVVVPSNDAERVFREEAGPTHFELVSVPWDEQGVGEVAIDLLSDCGAIASDVRIEGIRQDSELRNVFRGPLDDLDRSTLHANGGAVDRILSGVARHDLRPGMVDHDVSSLLHERLVREEFEVAHVMVGYDERVRRYRHPICVGDRLRRYAFLHVAARRRGLHAIVTRLVYFGQPPADIENRHRACRNVFAACVERCRESTSFSGLYEVIRSAYEHEGYSGVWREHLQGGSGGYELCDPTYLSAPDTTIEEGLPMVWFPTISGAKVEETVIAGPESGIAVTLPGDTAWPTVPVGGTGTAVEVADIMRQ